MRQLYQACAAPIVNYTSTVWHNLLKDKTHLRSLQTVQWTALICILSAFKTASTTTLEIESYLLPTHLRLKHHAQILAACLSTLPHDHPARTVVERAKIRNRHIGLGHRFPLAETLRTMGLDRLQALEIIDPKPQPPWQTPAFMEIEIEPDHKKVQAESLIRQAAPSITVYTDTSGQQNNLGVAAVALDKNNNIIQSQQICVRSMEYWSVYAAELMVIYYAVSLVLQLAMTNNNPPITQHEPTTILSDSMSALQAIVSLRNKSGQHIIQAITHSARELDARGIPLHLQWVPGHCSNPSNKAADQLAKKAVSPNKKHPFQHLLSREKGFIRHRIQKQWENEWRTSPKGGHLRRIDKNLPSIHTRRLYGPLPRNRAYLLTQLRTGHSWLATHTKLHHFRDDDKCKCGAPETVVHILVDCPKLKGLHQTLQRKIRTAFNNITDILGGGSQGKQGKQDDMQDSSVLGTILDFTEASQRFQSHTPLGC